MPHRTERRYRRILNLAWVKICPKESLTKPQPCWTCTGGREDIAYTLIVWIEHGRAVSTCMLLINCRTQRKSGRYRLRKEG